MFVRDETEADIEGIRAVVTAAFPGPEEADLVDRLRADGDAAYSLVAVEAGRIVGHILLSPMSAPFRALGLGPLAVTPDRQRSGIGRALVETALARARADAWQAVFVLGDPGYYERFGFRADLAAGFDSPYAGPYLMALSLGGETLPANAGRIEYAPAFGSLGSDS